MANQPNDFRSFSPSICQSQLVSRYYLEIPSAEWPKILLTGISWHLQSYVDFGFGILIFFILGAILI